MNRVYLVEEFMYRVDFESYQPTENEVKHIGELLGQPTRKLSVVQDRYRYIFRNLVEKKCARSGDYSLCIYTWRTNTPLRLFPLALHVHGTIILFEKEKPRETLAYPFNKPLSYNKSPGLSPIEYQDKTPREVTTRVDGWHLTAYYNPLINQWIFATRYTLHNMYYSRKQLVVDPVETISNPYVELADKIASRDGLYEKLAKYKNWTFTFVLEGPEPAITKPPYPIGVEPEKYKLYLLIARDPSGKIYTWSETRKLLDYETPSLIEPRRLGELYDEARRRLDIRSYFAFIDTDDPENPVIAELESDYYQDAMNAKYLNDAKSAALLTCEGLAHELSRLLGDQRGEIVLEIDNCRKRLEEVVLNQLSLHGAWRTASTIVGKLIEVNVKSIKQEEVLKALTERNIKRVVKKIMSTLLEGKNLLRSESVKTLRDYVEKLSMS
ncbi:MAG: hypothetical protein QXE81_06365 [Desulfurococcaceae archaeon]